MQMRFVENVIYMRGYEQYVKQQTMAKACRQNTTVLTCWCLGVAGFHNNANF